MFLVGRFLGTSTQTKREGKIVGKIYFLLVTFFLPLQLKDFLLQLICISLYPWIINTNMNVS